MSYCHSQAMLIFLERLFKCVLYLFITINDISVTYYESCFWVRFLTCQTLICQITTVSGRSAFTRIVNGGCLYACLPRYFTWWGTLVWEKEQILVQINTISSTMDQCRTKMAYSWKYDIEINDIEQKYSVLLNKHYIPIIMTRRSTPGNNFRDSSNGHDFVLM